MTRLNPLIIVLLFISISICQAAGQEVSGLAKTHEPSEDQVEKEIVDSVKMALNNSAFDKLEELSKSFRENKSRTPAGGWKLSWFYAAFPHPADEHSILAFEQAIDAWIRAYPQSPSAHIMKSRALLDHAWIYRGNKTAKDVPDSAWQPFHHFVDLSSENQVKYKTISSVDPQWYASMVDVATAASWDKPRVDALVKEAVEREPYYYQLYFSAFIYFLPKWHGSLAEADAFAKQAETWTSKEDGHGVYARIYRYVDQTNVNHVFLDTAVSWPEMQKGFEDILAKYPNDWNLHNYAKFACLAGDKETAHRLMDQIVKQVLTYTPHQQVDFTANLSTLDAAWEEKRYGLFKRCTIWVDNPSSTKATAPTEDSY